VQLLAGESWQSNAVPLLVFPEQGSTRFFQPEYFWKTVTAESRAGSAN
jgi:hypothetical protein